MLKRIKQITLNVLKNGGIFQLALNSQWRQDRLLILAYHGISIEDEHEYDSDLFMSPDLFRSRLDLLKAYNCNVLPLNEAITRLYKGDLPHNSVALTFDDGYYNFYKQAYPIIKEYGFPTTLYLTTFYSIYNRPVFDCACQYILWKSREQTLDLSGLTGTKLKIDLIQAASRSFVFRNIKDFCSRENLNAVEMDKFAAHLAAQLDFDYEDLASRRLMNYLNPDEIRVLASDNLDIQIHTHRHQSPLDQHQFKNEILENVIHIQDISSIQPTHFCYPGGIYDMAFLDWLADLDIVSATTCEPGLASRNSKRLLLPRLVDVTALAPIEFEGWLTGVSSAIPRRKFTYNRGVN
ncbi:MAG: polysaccharide deacetylase family protein [Acidobacteria bacterium]|nr:polysaccharide deacetylase family protein [Acidobacteriota bacterium]